MAVNTVPNGYPTIPILATLQGDELYEFLNEAMKFKCFLNRNHVEVNVGSSRV